MAFQKMKSNYERKKAERIEQVRLWLKSSMGEKTCFAIVVIAVVCGILGVLFT